MKGRRYLGWIAILALAVLLSLPAPVSWRLKAALRDDLGAFPGIAHIAASWFGRMWRTVASLPSAARENERMAQELAAACEEIRLLKALRQENEELRGMLDLKKRSRRNLLACEVIGRGDATGWWRTVTISKGASDAVRPGMAVIAAGGLVGRTWEVAESSSIVLLITDPMFKASCRFSRTGTVGILQGGGVSAWESGRMSAFAPPRPFHVEYVSKDYRILPRDEVVTSGLGDVLPEGLLIGYATKAAMDPSGLFQKVDVAPAADLYDLGRVFVVLE